MRWVLDAFGCALLLGAMLTGAPSTAAAQRFSDVSSQAQELDEDLVVWAAPLVAGCREGSGAARRRCRQLRQGSYLVSLPARGHVRIGPYESLHEGFRVDVPVFVGGGAPHAYVSTVASRSGAFAPGMLAESFQTVEPSRAQRWLARNAIERLRLRMVVRPGRAWTDRLAGRRGVLIEVLGVQVFNESTGNVLLDSVAGAGELPTAPAELDARVRLWDSTASREAVWTAPDGRRVLLSIIVDAVPGHPDQHMPKLTATVGATYRDVARSTVHCCESNVSVAPRGSEEVLVITSDLANGSESARGTVTLVRWNAQSAAFESVAEWHGANSEPPPPGSSTQRCRCLRRPDPRRPEAHSSSSSYSSCECSSSSPKGLSE